MQLPPEQRSDRAAVNEAVRLADPDAQRWYWPCRAPAHIGCGQFFKGDRKSKPVPGPARLRLPEDGVERDRRADPS